MGQHGFQDVEPSGFVHLPPNAMKFPATIDLDQCGSIAADEASLKPGL